MDIVYLLPHGKLSNGQYAVKLSRAQIKAAQLLSRLNLGQRDAIIQYAECLRDKRMGMSQKSFLNTDHRLD